MHIIAEFILYVERAWLATPEPVRKIAEIIFGPIKKEIAYIALGAAIIASIYAIIKITFAIMPVRRGSFDPSDGMTFPASHRIPFFARVILHVCGSDPIILRELPASSIRRRMLYIAGLLLATSWAIAGSYLFATYVFPDVDIKNMYFFIGIYSISVFVIDITIISSNRPSVPMFAARILLAVSMGLLTSAPILVNLFAAEIHSNLLAKIDHDSLATSAGETVKADRERVHALNAALIALEGRYKSEQDKYNDYYSRMTESKVKAEAEASGSRLSIGDLGATTGIKTCGAEC